MSHPLSANRSRATLNDVARRAGVSASTVSLVLSGKATTRRICDDTHLKVREAAEALGYTPNLLHRSMRRGRTHVLSFYNAYRNREWSDLYMDRISAAIEHAGGMLGYDVLVHCNFARGTKETFEFLNGGLSDGLILFNPQPDEPLIPLFLHAGTPVVVIDPRDRSCGLPFVCDDFDAGMKLLADELAQYGHQRIAVVAEPSVDCLDRSGRLQSLRAHLHPHSIEIPDEQVVGWNGSAAEVADALCALESKPTAVFVWHDRATYRVVECLEAKGVSIPDQMSIVSYDGMVWPSTSKHVISSVLVSLDEVAKAAVGLLNNIVEDTPQRPRSITVPVTLFPGTTLGLGP